jgi:hypothetical protein
MIFLIKIIFIFSIILITVNHKYHLLILFIFFVLLRKSLNITFFILLISKLKKPSAYIVTCV